MQSDNTAITQDIAPVDNSKELEPSRLPLRPLHRASSPISTSVPLSKGPIRHTRRKAARMQSPYGGRLPKARVPAFEEDPLDFDDFAEAYDDFVLATKDFPTMLCERLGCERSDSHRHSRGEIEAEISHSPLSYLMTPVSVMRQARYNQGEPSHTPIPTLGKRGGSQVLTSVQASGNLNADRSGAQYPRHALPKTRHASRDSQKPAQARVNATQKAPRAEKRGNIVESRSSFGVEAVNADLQSSGISDEGQGHYKPTPAGHVQPDVRRDLTVLAADGLLPYWYSYLP